MKNKIMFLIFLMFLSTGVFAQKPTLGVIEFEIKAEKVKNISKHLYSYLQQQVRKFVSDKYEIIVPPNLNLEDMYMMFACDSPTKDCMVSIAKAIKVKYMIYGSINYQNGKYELILKMLDSEKGKIIKRGRLLGDLSSKEAMNENIDKALMKMFDIKGVEVRFLSVDTNGIPADVYIDGKKVGKSPLILTNKDVKPGNYKLMIKKDGYETFKKDIVLSENRIETVDVKLKPVVIPAVKKKNPEKSDLKNKISINKKEKLDLSEDYTATGKPWYKEYWVWGAAGAVVTVTAITIWLLNSEDSSENSYNVVISF